MLSVDKKVADMDEIQSVRRLYELKADVVWKRLMTEPGLVNDSAYQIFSAESFWQINKTRKSLYEYVGIDNDPYKMRSDMINLHAKIASQLTSYDGRT